MSEEQTPQNQNKPCKCLIVLVTIAFIMSLASLVLSVLNFTAHPGRQQAADNGGQVVISKQYDKGRSLEKAVKTKKPMIVFFYTDWCGYCQRFAPVFDEVTKDSKVKKNFAIAYVNCEKQENQKHMQEYSVNAFPTVFVVDENNKRTHLDNNTFFNDDSKEVLVKKVLELIDED